MPNAASPTQKIYCSEPSPDWATALATAMQLSGNVTVPQGPTGSVNGSASTTETVTQLAGRTAGVLALRDGLYAACQAYANGVLGQDAYALVLSQYGNLLIKLASVSADSTGGASQSTVTPAQASVQALLVACISEYDHTRLGTAQTNDVLDRATCQKLIGNIADSAPTLLKQ
jgi:hypothetical protein